MDHSTTDFWKCVSGEGIDPLSLVFGVFPAIFGLIKIQLGTFLEGNLLRNPSSLLLRSDIAVVDGINFVCYQLTLLPSTLARFSQREIEEGAEAHVTHTPMQPIPEKP